MYVEPQFASCSLVHMQGMYCSTEGLALKGFGTKEKALNTFWRLRNSGRGSKSVLPDPLQEAEGHSHHAAACILLQHA